MSEAYELTYMVEDVAQGAYEAGVRVFPDKLLMLRDGIRVVMSTRKA